MAFFAKYRCSAALHFLHAATVPCREIVYPLGQ
jgi:hypothetical protein